MRTLASTPAWLLVLVWLAVCGALAVGTRWTSRRRVAFLPVGLVLVVGMALALRFAISAPCQGGFVASGYPIDNVVHDLQSGLFHR